MANITTRLSAAELANKLKSFSKQLKVEVKENDVIASAKSLVVDPERLMELSKIISGNRKITFGRSGANFRMIISEN